MIQINNFEELIPCLKSPELTNEQVTQIVAKTMRVYLYAPELPPRKKLIELLTIHYEKWHNKIESPLFLRDENDVIF